MRNEICFLRCHLHANYSNMNKAPSKTALFCVGCFVSAIVQSPMFIHGPPVERHFNQHSLNGSIFIRFSCATLQRAPIKMSKHGMAHRRDSRFIEDSCTAVPSELHDHSLFFVVFLFLLSSLRLDVDFVRLCSFYLPHPPLCR